MEGKEKIHIGELISAKLEEDRRSVPWLAKQINTDRSNLNKILKKDYIHSSLIWRIADAMDINFFMDIAESFRKYKENK